MVSPPPPHRPGHTAARLIVAALLVHSITTAMAGTAPATLPSVDWAALGTVSLLGSYAGLSVVNSSLTAAASDPTSAAVLSRDPTTGTVTLLGASNVGGTVSALCTSNATGDVYVGGHFTTIANVSASNVAVYRPASSKWSALGTGLNGPVNALACGKDGVWAGGQFSAPATNAAFWKYDAAAWTAPSFGGLNGAVWSINEVQGASDARSVVWGGAFTVAFANASTGINTSSPTATANAALQSAGAAPTFNSLGSGLSPIPVTLNFAAGVILDGTPSSADPAYANPDVILCPPGLDGPSNSWRMANGYDKGVLTLNLGRAVQTLGIRVGNTFVGGSGSKTFSAIAIPNDNVLTLKYLDVSTGAIATCSDACPLSNDPTIPYQDFLLDSAQAVTGMQLRLFSHYGSTGGLHLFQLLSPGAAAYSQQTYNAATCSQGLGVIPGTNNVSTIGTWVDQTINANISGTTQSVLRAILPPNTSPANAGNVSWQLFVPSSGNWTVELYTPGCQTMQDCGFRTNVQLVFTPFGGVGEPVTTSVNQRNNLDQTTVVYSGQLQASSIGGGATATLTLGAASPRSVDMLADHLIMTASSTTSNATVVSEAQANGVWEDVLKGKGIFGDGTTSTNISRGRTSDTATAIDALGQRLRPGSSVRSVAVGLGWTFVGGNFASSNGQNIVAVRSGQKTDAVIANGGLNGQVTSLAIAAESLFAGGMFTATSDGAVTGLAGLAKLSLSEDLTKWISLPAPPASLGNLVTDLSLGTTQVNGKDRQVLLVTGAGNTGLAVYDVANDTWMNNQGGFFSGNLTTVATSKDVCYVAGNVAGFADVSAPGAVLLKKGSKKSSGPQINPLGFSLSSPAAEIGQNTSGSAASTSNSTSSRRWWNDIIKVVIPRNIHPSSLLIRQATSPSSLNPMSLPSALPTDGQGEILASGFWKDDVVVGGTFVTTNNVKNIGLYSTSKSSLEALKGGDLQGEVLAIQVSDEMAYVGGDFTSPTGKAGFDAYDLHKKAWSTSISTLTPYPGQPVVVRSIASRPGKDSVLVVAGSFLSAGSLSCNSICLWDTKKSQWSALGSGLEGVVGSIDFAGKKAKFLIVSGSFLLNGAQTYVARWNFDTSSWENLGAASSVPGPSTALRVDDGNESNIYLAGSSTSSSAPYMLRWDGTHWSDVNSGHLVAGSGVQQLAFVPLSARRSEAGGGDSLMENDRMLMVSGQLALNGGRKVSTVLFDGQQWYPYFSTLTKAGAPGVISALLYSSDKFRVSARHFKSIGLVILISMAIALGIVFLCVLIGLLIALRNRDKDEANGYPVDEIKEDDNEDTIPRHRPTSLLATLNAATAAMTDHAKEILSGPTSGGSGNTPLMGAGGDRSPRSPGFGSSVITESALATAGMGAAAGGFAALGDEKEGDYRRARWSFAQEREGELSVRAGEELQVLDRSDPEWWLVRRHDGKQGAVPADWFL